MTPMAQEAHLIAQQLPPGIRLNYSEDCRLLDGRHMRIISELINHFKLQLEVKVFDTPQGFIVELTRIEETITHWASVGATHRPGRMNRFHMSIISVLGIRWVEWGNKSITVGL